MNKYTYQMDTPYYSTPYYTTSYYSTHKSFDELADDIVNNKIVEIELTHSALNSNNFKHIIKLLEKNISIKLINFASHICSTESIKLLSEVLKINTTLEELFFECYNINDESLEILINGLKYNKSVKKLRLFEYALGAIQLNLITDLLKVNKSITHLDIVLERVIVDTDSIRDFINTVSLNKTLTHIRIPLYFGDLNICNQFANMLKSNKTLIKICVFAGARINLDGLNLIADALEENFHVTSLDDHNSMLRQYLVKCAVYTNRNEHNIKLKSMSLVDVDYNQKSHEPPSSCLIA